MTICKLTLQLTVMCATESLEEATNAYGGMSLAELDHAITYGEDIGSGLKIVASEEIADADQVRSELEAIGNDGSFFDVELASRCGDEDEDHPGHDFKPADGVDTGTDADAIICKNCEMISATSPNEAC